MSETPGSLDPKAPGHQCQPGGRSHPGTRQDREWGEDSSAQEDPRAGGCVPRTIRFVPSAGLRARECAGQIGVNKEVGEQQQEDLVGR